MNDDFDSLENNQMDLGSPIKANGGNNKQRLYLNFINQK